MKEITFDRFIRGIFWLLLAVGVGLLIKHLSGVLLPFFIAWLMAYMMYPLVRFFQYRCRLRNRVLSIVVATLTVLLAITLLLLLIVPPTIAEFMKLKDVAVDYIGSITSNGRVSAALHYYAEHYINGNRWMTLMQNNNVVDGVREALSQMFNLLTGTFEVVIGLFSIFATLLYFFFILMDYEALSSGWIKFVPRRSRPVCLAILRDLQHGMGSYFRGQAAVAFCVGLLFSAGFLIIGFPMAVGLGLFIGLLNMVPYLQLVGFIPTIVLALVESAQTGEGFWSIFLPALAVFCVVQLIQDLYLTPRIMGKTMGLNPAIIFLSLSVWGCLLGFIGLVIALPLTTILISYYKQLIARYDRKEQEGAAQARL